MVTYMKKYLFIILLFTILLTRLIYINVIDKNKYQELLFQKTNNYIYGYSAPRGRIIDCKGRVLVDNKGIKSIYYTRLKDISKKDEIDIAYKLANIIDIEINENSLKNFWLILNNNGDDLINEDEWKLYRERKLTSEDIKNLKYERITEDKLNELSELDKKSATIYNLMNKGYSYDKKLIVKGISDKEYSLIVDSNIKGITEEMTWERVYNYDNTLRDIFGSIGSVPEEEIDEYLKKGYQRNDIVGISYLEKEYEDYLKGEKDIYKVNNDNTITLYKEGKKGNDLVLSIDIDVQLELEKSIKENIINAKKLKNTDYYSEAYAIVGNPSTGEIIALSGQKLVSDINMASFKNINTNLINTSYTVGSVVKMATISTGYKYNVIDINKNITDGCVKLYNVPLKCSYKSLGSINDLTAISKSSNYYQFRVAIDITNNKYKYNMDLQVDEDDFNKFREMFKSYGLGNITGIDLPNEDIGIIGKTIKNDLLLNLSIGQYDTYTPIELFQYVNTIASLGERRSPSLVSKIIDNQDIIKENNYNIINRVELDKMYLERLRDAMHLAITSGTAKNYINSLYNGAGKTGTSETFIDTNNDGIMDTKTISNAFVGFAPYDNPKYSIIVLTPNLYVDRDYKYQKIHYTKYISNNIMQFLFENS